MDHFDLKFVHKFVHFQNQLQLTQLFVQPGQSSQDEHK